MARSSYIYVVLGEGASEDVEDIAGTFTVKWETQAFLDGPRFRPRPDLTYVVERYPDGGGEATARWTLEEF